MLRPATRWKVGTYDVLSIFENQVRVVPPQLELLVGRQRLGFRLFSRILDDVHNSRYRTDVSSGGLLISVLQQRLGTKGTRSSRPADMRRDLGRLPRIVRGESGPRGLAGVSPLAARTRCTGPSIVQEIRRLAPSYPGLIYTLILKAMAPSVLILIRSGRMEPTECYRVHAVRWHQP